MKASFAALMLVAAFGVSADAQAPQQPSPFRAGTDVVEVDVIVRDKAGQFVSDLAMDDFELQDEGRPQHVQQLYLRVNSSQGWSREPAAGGRPRSPDLFLTVFDDAHMTVAAFKRTQAAALTLFSKQWRQGDFGGIVANGRIVNDRLSSDRDELVKAVKSAQPARNRSMRAFEEAEWPRLTEVEATLIERGDRDVLANAAQRACADEPQQCQNTDPLMDIRAKAGRMADVVRAESNQTLQLLNTVLGGLEKFEGRKTILLLTEGFLADDSWPLVQQAVSLAARVNARIYTLDARGLGKGLTSVDAARPTDTSMRTLEQMDFGADSVNSLAVDTGGFVVRNTNMFDRAIAQIVDDATSYYVLGYVPSESPDGKFHRIGVKVRRPGVGVRARRGYRATPRPGATAAAAIGTSAFSPAGSVLPEISAADDPIAPISAPELPAVPAVLAAAAVANADSTDRAAAAGVRVRPDASKHLDLLLPNPSADRAAADGWQAYQRGDLASARLALGVAASSPGAEAWVHYALGQANYALRQWVEAVSEWEKVRAAAHDFEPVYFDLVDGYLQLKQYDRAIRLLREGAVRWPKDPEVFNALGVVQTGHGSLDDAIASFQNAIVVSPAESTSYFNLGKAMELRYFRSRHYYRPTQKWIANENDRAAAVENYGRYLAIGGPYAEQAREGLTRLNWVP